MGHARPLPSGNWQGRALRPDGREVTKVWPTKKQADDWAEDEEAKYRAGDLRDPRSGNILVGAWYERWHAVSGGETGTRKRTESFWKNYVGPKWSAWPMASITRMEAKAWVGELKNMIGVAGRPLSADSIQHIVQVMSAMYREALDQHPPLVLVNPFANLGKKVLPTIPPAPIFWYEEEEVDAILAAIARPSDRVLVEVGFLCGLRPGELYGLFGDRVNWLRATLEVTRVETREGLREYPKEAKSHRTVPVDPDVFAGMQEVIAGRDLRGRVFVTPKGQPIDDSNFRQRVWNPAVLKADVRRFDPRAMRHTAATRLVMAGVDLYRVQDLLGHEDYSTTQRYAHLTPNKHEAILEAWAKRRRTAG